MNVKEEIATYFEVFKCLEVILHNYKFIILAVRNEKRPDKNRVRKIMMPGLIEQEAEAVAFARQIDSERTDNGFFSRPSIFNIVPACDTVTLDYYIKKANEYETMVDELSAIAKAMRLEHLKAEGITDVSQELPIGGVYRYLYICKSYLTDFKKAVSDFHSSFDQDNGQFEVQRKSMALDRKIFKMTPKEMIEDLMKIDILKGLNEEGVKLESEILEAFLFGGPDIHYPERIFVQRKKTTLFYNFINSFFTMFGRTDVTMCVNWFCKSSGEDLKGSVMTNGQNSGTEKTDQLVMSYLVAKPKKDIKATYIKK